VLYHARRQGYNKLIPWLRVDGIAGRFGLSATREYPYYQLTESNVDSAQCVVDATPLMMKPEKRHISQSASCPFVLAI
jgi:hypothetical protein